MKGHFLKEQKKRRIAAALLSLGLIVSMTTAGYAQSVGQMQEELDEIEGKQEEVKNQLAQVEQDIEALFQAIQEFIQQQNLQDAVSVSQDGGKIFITFSQAIFFNGDSAVLREDAYPILSAMTEMLDSVASSIDEVRVQGHTARAGNDPNRTVQDRTLSSQRAANVVIYIQDHGILNPARLVSEGFGEWRPIESNATAEGRAKNRRVEMIISGRDIQAEIDGEDTLSQFEQVFEVIAD